MSSTEESNDQWPAPSPLSSGSSTSPQQVPQPSCPLSKLIDSAGITVYDSIESPYLKIIEQPQSFFKFRYQSEMDNSHGCIYGKSYENDRTLPKTYPEVELFNYGGKAKIKCELALVDKPFEHPHKLRVSDNENIMVEVPVKNNYRVRFRGLCIIYTSQKDVTNWLFRGHDTEDLEPESRTAVFKQCKKMAMAIDLNRLRLKFSAVQLDSDQEICEPVFSDLIQNLKNAATNKLKICRMSRSSGRACGADDLILLVEKVVKSNIMVRFFEESEVGHETWTANAPFNECDVHHQYAISLRIPAYMHQSIKKRVKVWIQLVRPSDGQKSEPREFYYTPGPLSYWTKKRKLNSEQECSTSDIAESYEQERAKLQSGLSLSNGSATPQSSPVSFATITTPVSQCSTLPVQPIHTQTTLSSQIPHLNIEAGPSQMVHSTPREEPMVISTQDTQMTQVDITEAQQTVTEETPSDNDPDLTQFLTKFGDNDDFLLPLFEDLLTTVNNEYMASDSGRGEITTTPKLQSNTEDNGTDLAVIRKMTKHLRSMLMLIRILDATKKDTVKKTLRALFDIRLSNGDTFLHLTVHSKQPLMDYVINLVHEYKMVELLNLQNADMQTILHVAIINRLSDMIPMLLAKGCDPMLEDVEGNTAIHYAVMYETCLEPLLDKIKNLNIPHNINAFNNERQTALHLSVIYKSETSARKLVASGASYNTRDNQRRSPLHLAAYDRCLPVLAALLDHVKPENIDEMDDHGCTVLQILSGHELKEGSLDVIKVLLDKYADPLLKRKGHKVTAWSLARGTPEIRELMRKYIVGEPESDDDDDDSEDEFESADEGDLSDIDEELSEIIQPLKTLTMKNDSDVTYLLRTGTSSEH